MSGDGRVQTSEDRMVAQPYSRSGWTSNVVSLALLAGLAVGCDSAGRSVQPELAVHPAARTLVIQNGSPGMATLHITLNGQTFVITRLRANEMRTIDVSSARGGT